MNQPDLTRNGDYALANQAVVFLRKSGFTDIQLFASRVDEESGETIDTEVGTGNIHTRIHMAEMFAARNNEEDIERHIREQFPEDYQ